VIDHGDLSGINELLLVAEKRSFTAAAAALRVTPSAVSQSISALERRLSVPLLQRTTRSVGLTEAGVRFLAQLRPAMDNVRAAFEALDDVRGRPVGTLRLNVPRLASSSVLEPILARFLAAHAGIRLDVTVEDGLVDIVGKGFDAGIRLGETLDRDMVAVPLGGQLRMAVVGSPSYFAAHGRPKHPHDLHDHACLNHRHVTSQNVYRWEFTVAGRDITMAVDGRLVSNDVDLLVRAALDGLGLAYLMESTVARPLADGRLQRVLTRYCPRFPGLYLYYPNRKQVAPKLRALVDFLKAHRRS
jgi:DNA-binding transcriptional LysR family regulator